MALPLSVEEQIGVIDTGLKTLKHTRMLGFSEFKDMYTACDRHYRDVKLGHLIGKPSDLIQKSYEDTQFYCILVRMLVEASLSLGMKQKNDLLKVYNWYMANKHVLHAAPRFGKAHQEIEAREAFNKATSSFASNRPKSGRASAKRSASRRGRTASNDGKTTPKRLLSPTARDKAKNEINAEKSQVKIVHCTTRTSAIGHKLHYVSFKQQLAGNPPVDARSFGKKRKHGGVKAYVEERNRKEFEDISVKMVQSEDEDDEKENEVDAPTPRNTPTRDLNCPKMIHTIASLVNPHVHHQDAQSHLYDFERNQSRGLERPQSVIEDRAVKLRMWQAYQERQTYGQDVLGKLQFCGRSGTPYGVRYVAHGNAESPEEFTKDVVKIYSDIEERRTGGVPSEENKVVKSRLEDFYKQSERYYPHNLPKYPSFKPKSAPAGGRRTEFMGSSNVSESLEQNSVQESKPVDLEPKKADVKLDTLVTMIDSVTDDMSYYKEKLAPKPSPGFAQPVVPVSESSAPRSISQSPVPRPKTSSPSNPSPSPRTVKPLFKLNNIPAPESSDYTVHFRREATPVPSTVEQVVDWRGKVVPDSTRYKWADTGFGSHSYIKKLGKHQRARSAGASSAGSRPKTAPVSTKEKWKTEKPSDANKPLPGAATHPMKEIDPEAVDSMVQVQYLGGTSPDPLPPPYLMPPRSSLGFYYSDFQIPEPDQPPSMEYVSFVAPKNIQDVRGRSESRPSADSPFPQPPPQTPAGYRKDEEDENDSATFLDIDHPDVNDLDDELLLLEDLQAQDESHILKEELQDENFEVLPRTDEPVADKELTEEPEGDIEPSAEEANLDLNEEPVDGQNILDDEEKDNIAADEITSAEPNTRKIYIDRKLNVVNIDFDESTLAPERGEDLGEYVVTGVRHGKQTSVDVNTEYLINKLKDSNQGTRKLPKNLVVSEQCNVSLNLDPGSRDGYSHYYENEAIDPIRKKRPMTGSIIRKPEYNANIIQDRAKSATPGGRILNREQEMAKKMIVGPLRTAPSIPTPHDTLGGRSPRSMNQYEPHLDQYARKLNSPRRYMQKVSELLRHDTVHEDPSATSIQPEAKESGLNICGHALISSKGELTHYAPSEQTENDKSPPARGSHEHGGHTTTETGQPRRGSQSKAKARCSQSDSQLKPYQGRPIPEYGENFDPDDIAASIKRTKEAKAAVNIQRIFRGYIVRNCYKQLQKLDGDRRERLEDRRLAAIEAEKKYKEHLKAKEAIYKRERDPSVQEWAEGYNNLKDFREKERRFKELLDKRDLAMKNHQDSMKRELIGPHVYVYQSFHPKQIGPTQKELNLAATIIQKNARRFIIRKKFERLQRKSAWHAKTFQEFMKEYYGLLKRIQRRHGNQRPKTPFSYDEILEFMDIKKRYESVFDHKSFGGELDLTDLQDYFKECDLYPSQLEVDEAFDAVFRGKARKKNKGLSKKECNEITFELYPPSAAGVENQRMSTWMNPIIDGIEAAKFFGIGDVRKPPLEPCMRLVAASIRMRREAEEAVMKAERRQQEEEEKKERQRQAEERRQLKEQRLQAYLAKKNLL